MPIISALGQMRPEDYEFEARLSSTESVFNYPHWRFQHCDKIIESCQVVGMCLQSQLLRRLRQEDHLSSGCFVKEITPLSPHYVRFKSRVQNQPGQYINVPTKTKIKLENCCHRYTSFHPLREESKGRNGQWNYNVCNMSGNDWCFFERRRKKTNLRKQGENNGVLLQIRPPGKENPHLGGRYQGRVMDKVWGRGTAVWLSIVALHSVSFQSL